MKWKESQQRNSIGMYLRVTRTVRMPGGFGFCWLRKIFRADATSHRIFDKGNRICFRSVLSRSCVIWREKTSTWLEHIANVDQRCSQGSILTLDSISIPNH